MSVVLAATATTAKAAAAANHSTGCHQTKKSEPVDAHTVARHTPDNASEVRLLPGDCGRRWQTPVTTCE